MHRRTFLRNTALCAFAVSASGYIRFDGEKYTGDCETTTDILGPFYRPGSPLRTNLRIPGDNGTPVELSGTVRHNDCRTPYPNAKVELWHCDAKGVYDNTTSEFLYRGTAYTDENGKYQFQTVLPVPYAISAGRFRPAHYHLMITARGYQPFITQLYFKGDEYIKTDPSASTPGAQRRILDLQHLPDGSKRVSYDVSMAPKLAADAAVIERLAGTYHMEDNAGTKVELFQRDNVLWLKNEVFGTELEYIGNNTFQDPGMPEGVSSIVQFQILTGGKIKATRTDVNPSGKKVMVALKD
jgi:catechol 1,2-dioxygenase